MGRIHAKRRQKNKKAILLAHFGTSYPSALASLDNIKKHVVEAFPGIETRICFTSNMVRNIWASRRKNPDRWKDEGVSDEVLGVQTFLAAVGNLQDQGYRTIVVQPTHVYHGEQYEDLKSCVLALRSIRTIKEVWAPFEQIVISRPLLGTYGVLHDYLDDIAEVVAALGKDVEQAEERDSALVYVGHGNDFFSSGVFQEMLHALRNAHPERSVYMGMVEGFPGLEETRATIVRDGVSNVLLKPFMITAGDHAHNDIDNAYSGSWRGRLEAAGCRVETIMEGLGSNDAFAALFARRIGQTAEDYGIELHA